MRSFVNRKYITTYRLPDGGEQNCSFKNSSVISCSCCSLRLILLSSQSSVLLLLLTVLLLLIFICI